MKKFNRIFPKARRLGEKLFLRLFTSQTYRKRREELEFWKNQLASNGGLDYWRNQYFEAYCHFLGVQRDSFKGKVLLDLGCGPHGAISLFEAKSKLALDPLVNSYQQLFNLPNEDVEYLNCGGEEITLENETVDVVISRNAIDHVEDVRGTFFEVHRILRMDGEIIFSVNYQLEPTATEPNVLNDEILKEILHDKFSYEIIKRFPENYDAGLGGPNDFIYPHDIVTIRGTKL